MHAQGSSTSTDVIDPARRIDWSRAGVLGGIPRRADGSCASLDARATAADINNAIAACANGVVNLAPGTYNLSAGVTFRGSSNVTLRGAGPEQTILKFTGTDPCGPSEPPSSARRHSTIDAAINAITARVAPLSPREAMYPESQSY